MPRRNGLFRLNEICVQYIANHIEFWCEDYTKNYMGKHSFLHIIGPFEDLTSEQVQKVLSTLQRKRQLARHHLQLLLHNRVQHLDLSGCSKIINDQMIYVVAARCKRLKNLNLSNCSRVSSKAFLTLADKLSDAICLNLKQTRCIGDALRLIITNCTKLRELNLQGVQVNDSDIFLMCQAAQKGEGCCRLVSLDVLDTWVTEKAVTAVINHLPEIRHLNCNNVFVIFPEGMERHGQEIDGCDVGIAPNKMCKLKSLTAENPNALITDNNLFVTCLHCPEVTKVVLAGPHGFTDAGLRHIVSLNKLKELTISSHHNNISFSGGVLPILQAVGKKITHLHLQDLEDIDVYAIGFLCPELQSLNIDVRSLDICNFISESSFNTQAVGQRRNPFDKLRKLVMYAQEENMTDDTMLVLLKHSHELETVDIIHMGSFKDAVLLEALENNRLLKLCKLSVFGCGSLSHAPITQLLLDDQNEIGDIRLLECREISLQDSRDFLKIIRKGRYNVTLEWT